MSDYGSPPPPGGDPYGGQPYGAPPPQQPYGGQPPYGAQPPQYGAPPPQPPYGGQPYGAAPQYGAPQQPYGAPGGYPGQSAVAGVPGGATVASMGRRLGARILDSLIIGVPFSIVYFVLVSATGTSSVGSGQVSFGLSGAPALLFQLVYFVVVVGYEIGLIGSRGATIGKQLLGIKVIREADGQVPGYGPAALRWVIPFAGTFACCVGWFVVVLSPFWDSTKRNQGYHDKVAKTLVVNR